MTKLLFKLLHTNTVKDRVSGFVIFVEGHIYILTYQYIAQSELIILYVQIQIQKVVHLLVLCFIWMRLKKCLFDKDLKFSIKFCFSHLLKSVVTFCFV